MSCNSKIDNSIHQCATIGGFGAAQALISAMSRPASAIPGFPQLRQRQEISTLLFFGLVSLGSRAVAEWKITNLEFRKPATPVAVARCAVMANSDVSNASTWTCSAPIPTTSLADRESMRREEARLFRDTEMAAAKWKSSLHKSPWLLHHRCQMSLSLVPISSD